MTTPDDLLPQEGLVEHDTGSQPTSIELVARIARMLAFQFYDIRQLSELKSDERTNCVNAARAVLDLYRSDSIEIEGLKQRVEEMEAEVLRVVDALVYAHEAGFKWSDDPLPFGSIAHDLFIRRGNDPERIEERSRQMTNTVNDKPSNVHRGEQAEMIENLGRLVQWCRAQDANATIWLHAVEARTRLLSNSIEIERLKIENARLQGLLNNARAKAKGAARDLLREEADGVLPHFTSAWEPLRAVAERAGVKSAAWLASRARDLQSRNLIESKWIGAERTRFKVWRLKGRPVPVHASGPTPIGDYR